MLQRILYRFHFLRCRMLPRLFQFFYRIRSIVHRQPQISFYLCNICGMYFEAVFSFYVLLYHFVGHSLFGLVCFGSFSDVIKRNFSLTLAKLNFYVDMSVWLFVGKQYHRLHMHRPANSSNLCCSTEIIMLDLLHWHSTFIITMHKYKCNTIYSLATIFGTY